MPCERTRDVLDKVRDFHRKLSEFYAKMQEMAHREKVRMLLGYMSRHEMHLEECLARYENEGAKGILDTWFQFTPPIAKWEFFEKLDLNADMSVDDVIQTAIKFDDCLVEFYLQVSEMAACEDVRALFSKLLNMEKAEERQAIRNALEL